MDDTLTVERVADDPVASPRAVDVVTTAEDAATVRAAVDSELAALDALTDGLINGRVDTF